MAKIAPQGRLRYFDENGAPLDGGKLYTYEAGTSTPKVTYTTATEETENTNPVILDNEGYADVWLGSGGYKFVLTDKNDVEQWTEDNIDGGAASGFASVVVERSSGFSLTTNEQNYVIVCTAALTVSLMAAATAGDGFVSVIINNSNGNVTLAADGSDLIDGAATLVVPSGASVTLYSNGVLWATSGYTRSVTTDVFRVRDNGDTTKAVSIDASNITTGTTRELTVQDVNGTVYVTGGQDVAVADGGTNISSYATGDIIYASGAGVLSKLPIGTANQVLKVNSGATAPEWQTMSVKKYATAEQTITAGGSIGAFTHGLGGKPDWFSIKLICKTAEAGYAINDELFVQYDNDQPDNGMVIYWDNTTTFSARYAVGFSGSPFMIPRKDTSAEFRITPANWRCVITVFRVE